jgi:predicted HTH transcriptional regulator
MNEIEEIVGTFAQNLMALFQKHSREYLKTEITKAARAGGGGGGSSNSHDSKPAKRSKGEKRTRSEIEKLKTKLERLISDNDGIRVEQINTMLGTSSSELALPLRELMDEKHVRTTGQRRGTTYFSKK